MFSHKSPKLSHKSPKLSHKSPKLFATPLSHFSRKVRVILDLYKISYDLIDIGNVAAANVNKFAQNPMMKIPVWVDGDTVLIESDHIVSYIVRKQDETDKFEVNTHCIKDLNARAIMNGIMSEEVKLILAQRTGIPTKQYEFFDKSLQAITNGLDWLASSGIEFDTKMPKYREIHFVCMWDHLRHYGLVSLDKFDKLDEIARRISSHEAINQSAPLAKSTTPNPSRL